MNEPIEETAKSNPDKRTPYERIAEFGLTIPLFSVFVFCGLYYYELGYLRELNVPSDFITIEPINNSYKIFHFLVGYFIVLFLLTQVQNLLLNRKKFKKRRHLMIYRIIVSVFLIGCCLVFYNCIPHVSDVIYLLVIFVVASLAYAFAALMNLAAIKYDTPSPYDIFENLITYPKSVALPLMIIAVGCIQMYIHGSLDAKTKSSFVETNDRQTFLIRKYENRAIYGISGLSKSLNHFIIVEGDSRDTILVENNIVIPTN